MPGLSHDVYTHRTGADCGKQTGSRRRAAGMRSAKAVRLTLLYNRQVGGSSGHRAQHSVPAAILLVI